MKTIVNEIQEKETLCLKLVNKLNKLPKTINRQIYVDRILGVVKNLEDQKKQISQILMDVENLQRDTNKISATSKRIFSVTDDLIFRTAQNEKDLKIKKQLNTIYRYVVNMREQFDNMTDIIQNISKTQNEIRDLEYQILSLKEKVETLELKKVKNDLIEVENENQLLANQIKALKKQAKKFGIK